MQFNLRPPTMTRQLQKELKKRDPFDSLEEEVVLNIHRTADQLSIRGSCMLRDYGLTPAQFSILRVLRSEGKALPILEIGNRTVRIVPGITGLIDRLEEAGLACRQRCTKDRRVVYVAITEKALELMGRVDGPLRGPLPAHDGRHLGAGTGRTCPHHGKNPRTSQSRRPVNSRRNRKC